MKDATKAITHCIYSYYFERLREENIAVFGVWEGVFDSSKENVLEYSTLACLFIGEVVMVCWEVIGQQEIMCGVLEGECFIRLMDRREEWKMKCNVIVFGDVGLL